MLICARNEDEVSHLEACDSCYSSLDNSVLFLPLLSYLSLSVNWSVSCYKQVWIYEDPAGGDSNMYVHHDIIIPAFPLCLAWLDCPIKGGEKGIIYLNSCFLGNVSLHQFTCSVSFP